MWNLKWPKLNEKSRDVPFKKEVIFILGSFGGSVPSNIKKFRAIIFMLTTTYVEKK